MRNPYSAAVLPIATALLLLACHGGGSSAPKPDFTVTVSPGSLSVPAGGSGFVTITATRMSGFSDALQVSLQGGPSGVSGTGTLATSATSLQLQVIVGSAVTPQVLSGLQVVCTSGSLSHSTPFALTVAASLPPGAIRPDGVQASGGTQQGGILSNSSAVGEPVPARAAQDASGGTAVRHGFHPSGRN